jgi:serine phosphatase RsbU (regulator of sigma subunit)/anti-sigma regulatory factor (Ser/Thr protein kinase)
LYDLSSFSLSDMTACSATLRRIGARAESMEDAAQAVVEYLRRVLVDGDGQPACALARLFKTHPLERLPAPLREDARAKLPGAEPSVRCLTLLGTAGDRPDWCSRHRSRGHGVIPLPGEEAVRAAPMIAGLVDQFGLDAKLVAGVARPDGPSRLDSQGCDVFHVEDARGSPLVPAQDFVAAHGIASVLGFGGLLPSGELFAVILFSRTGVSRRTADLFRTLAVSVKLALLPFVGGRVFDDDGDPGTTAPEAPLAVQAQALTQLVEVYERTAWEQAQRLESTLAQLQDNQARLREQTQVADTLHAVGQALSAELDLERLLQVATDAATIVTGAQFGAFFYNVATADGRVHTMYTVAGAPREAFDRFGLPRSTQVFDPAFGGTSVLRSDDITTDPRYGHNAPHQGIPTGHPPVRSYLGVPVVSRSGEVLGGLFFGHADAGVFSDRDERLAVGIAAQAAVAIDNARLYEHERAVAVALQESLLPQRLPALEDLEIASRYLPGAVGTHVGGDWFDVIPLSVGRVALVIGDVMGRGLQAAAVMGQLRAAIRAYAVMELPPIDVMTNLDNLVESLEGTQLVTCVYAVYDPATAGLCLANAGHVPPIVLHADGRTEAVAAGIGAPLGVGGVSFEEYAVALPPGTTLVLYTDGLVERRGQSLEDGIAALAGALRPDAPSLEDLCRSVISSRLGAAAGEDDVAVLMVRSQRAERPAVIDVTLPCDPAAVRTARARIGEVVAEVTRGTSVVDAAELIVSELVTNALRHAQSSVGLRLRLGQDALFVEVSDSDTRLPRLTRATPDDEHHRGLYLVEAMADRWGTRPTPDGKVVWAELALQR